MPESIFDRIVVPVASKKDARRTCKAVVPYLRETSGEVHVVHVIEQTEGYLDTASVEQLEQQAEEIFEAARDAFREADFASFETQLRYGSDVAETIYDVCDEIDATAIVFLARQTSRWKRLLTGDVALKLVTESPYPTIVLPEPDYSAE